MSVAMVLHTHAASRPDAAKPLAVLEEEDLLNSRGVETSPNRQISPATSTSSGVKEMSVLSSRALMSRQNLQQEMWSPEEAARKERVIPLLSPSLDLLSRSEPGVFGQIFYQNLFQNPEHAKSFKLLFAGKDMERTTNAFGRIPCEMLRLLMLPSKGLMVLETLSLALRHVDYGAQREHNEVFERSFLRALSQFLIREGGVWDADVSDGWSWVYSTFSDELLSALEVVKPKVEAVRSSWNQIITKSVMQSEFSDDSHASGTTHMSSRRHSVSGRTIASIHGTGGTVTGGRSHKSHQKRSTLNAEMSNEDGVDGRQRAVVSVGAAMARRLQEGIAQSKEKTKFVWSEKHGQKLGTALELVVSTATRPKELERNLFRLAQRHVELGVKPAHLKVFESCLFDLLATNLSAPAFESAQLAWKWLWDVVERTFVQVLVNWETMQTSLTASWEVISPRQDSAVKVARTFHNTLLDRVMVFRSMFKKRDGELSGHLNIRNTFLDLEDAPSLAEQIRGLRRVSSCPVLGESHREAHENNPQTVQTPEVAPKSPPSEPHVQDQAKEQIDQTDQAAARTRLSSNAKMFQPKPMATVPAPSTTYFATPPSRTYAMQGVQSQMLPSQPSVWAWSQQFQSLPGTCESPNQKGLLLSTGSPSVSMSKPKVILGSAALPSVGSGGHATGSAHQLELFASTLAACRVTDAEVFTCGPAEGKHRRFHSRQLQCPEALALIFAKALQLLVDCVHDSSLIETELEKISVMHCKFDLQAWHFEIFGQILLETLAEAGGQAWCNDYTEAWSMLYGMASQTFLEAIDSSRTSLSSALLQGSTKKVKEALSKAPRGERAASALQVGVGRRQLSPLLWALRDMHLEVLEILLSDILTIRADRQCFYYGVDDLWKRCPAILDALVEFAPHLLEPLLDGHMWVSRETTDGLRRVNLWVQYIYGNPEELEHVFAGPLGTLIERLPETHIEVFRHPVISETVNLKWHQFGRRRLIAVSLQQITCLISYLVVSMSGDLSLWLRLCACALWGTITAFQLAHGCYIAAWEACTQRCTSLDFKLCRLKVPRSLCQFFVQLRLVCCLLSLLLIETMVVTCFDSSSDASCLDGDHASPRVLSASVAFLQWIQMAELFKLHGKMAAVVLLGKAMMEDALRFMMGLGLWLIAVGASLHKLQDDETRPQNGFSSAYNLFAHVLGVGTDTDLTYYDSTDAVDTVVRIVYLGALWVSVVPILNVLIAAMVSTYSKAESMTLGLAIKARAGFVLRMEDMLRFKRRLHFFKDAGFDTALAFSEHDRGPSGGISMMCDTLQLKEHGSFGRRVGAVLFFSGETGTDQPWPSHDIPLLVNHVNTLSEKLPSQDLHRELLSELRVIRDATSRAHAASASPEPVAAPPVELTLKTLAAFAEADTDQHCFVAVEGRVYDVGAYLPNHPGGSSVLTSGRGKDVSELFRAAHSQLPRARETLAQLPVLGMLSSSEGRTSLSGRRKALSTTEAPPQSGRATACDQLRVGRQGPTQTAQRAAYCSATAEAESACFGSETFPGCLACVEKHMLVAYRGPIVRCRSALETDYFQQIGWAFVQLVF
eukprot:s2176_g5.t3